MSFKKHISVPNITQYGSQLFSEARQGLESSGATQNALDTYMYGLAGLTPEYGAGGSPEDLANLNTRIEAAQSGLSGLQTAKGQAGRQAVRGQLAAAGIDPTQIGGGGGLKGKLKRYLAANRARVAAGPNITGFQENATQAAQRQREQGLLTTEQEDLQKSLSMNADDVLSADPALAQSLKEAEAEKEQAQVGQFGTLAGAAGGTTGAVQNAAFAAQRAATISQARLQNIGLYQGLQQAQADQNQNLAASRGALASAPGAARAQLASSFGQLAGMKASQGAQQGQMQFQANAFNQTQPGFGESLLKGIGSLLQPFKGTSS